MVFNEASKGALWGLVLDMWLIFFIPVWCFVMAMAF